MAISKRGQYVVINGVLTVIKSRRLAMRLEFIRINRNAA